MGQAATTSDLVKRAEVVGVMLEHFKIERYVYLAVIGCCTLVLLGTGFIALFKSDFSPSVAVSVFGSGGTVTVMAGRLLKIWDDSKQILLGGGDDS